MSRPGRPSTLALVLAPVLAACGLGGGGITPVRTAFNKGVYHYSRGEYEQAVSWYRTAVEEEADDHRARFNLGLTLEVLADDHLLAGRASPAQELRKDARQTYQALLEIRDLEAVDLRSRAEVQRLVKEENADRERLFGEIAAAKNVDRSQLPRIRETYAKTLRANARPGDWVQSADGSWQRK